MNDRQIARHEWLHLAAGIMAMPEANLHDYDGEIEITQTGGRAVIFPSETGIKKLVEVPSSVLRAVAIGPLGALPTKELRAIIRSGRICEGESGISQHDVAMFERHGGSLDALEPCDIDVLSSCFYLARLDLDKALDGLIAAGTVTLGLREWLPMHVRRKTLEAQHASFKYLRDELTNPPDWYERRSARLYGC
jgi:hypothetical protein